MVFIRPRWWAQSQSFPVLFSRIPGVVLLESSSLIVELSFTCHLHLYYHQTQKICWTHQCVLSLQSCCLSFSSGLQRCVSFECTIERLGSEVLLLLSVSQLQIDEKWMEKNKPHTKAYVFTKSGSECGFVPLSGSFSFALVTPLCHKKKDFTFSMHSAASSSGCLFKDNEASICLSEKLSRLYSPLKPRFLDHFFLLLSLK